jgi:hypothetical protein
VHVAVMMNRNQIESNRDQDSAHTLRVWGGDIDRMYRLIHAITTEVVCTALGSCCQYRHEGPNKTVVWSLKIDDELPRSSGGQSRTIVAERSQCRSSFQSIRN